MPGGARGSLPNRATDTAVPDPARSESGTTTFAFCRAGDYRKLYLQTPVGVTNDEAVILTALRCRPDTPGFPLPAGYNGQVMRLFDDFGREVEMIASDLEHRRMLTRSQKYVDEALRAYFTTLTDVKERRIVEDLRAAFTGDIEQYVISALNRLQRDRLSGAALVEALSAIYAAFDLGAQDGDVARRGASRRARARQAKLVCSGWS